MQYQIKTLVLLASLGFISSTAHAGCEWTHGSLGQTIQSTSERLKLYSECKKDCGQLGAGLNTTIGLMNTASECGANVLTAKNSQMIEFFNRRFQLIRKLKNGQVFNTEPTPVKPVVIEARETKMTIPSDAYQELWSDDGARANSAPQPIQIPEQTYQPASVVAQPSPQALEAERLQAQRLQQQRIQAQQAQQQAQQQRMQAQQAQQLQARQQAQYQAQQLQAQRQQAQRQQQQALEAQQRAQAERARELHLAQQRRVEQQRQLQLQRQAQIELQNKRNAEARKRQILLIQHEERIRQKHLQHKRARALHIAKQKARQQQLQRAQN
ncbi:hypothetical protein EOL70_03870 [Leucothrix sargassi]|nr:hypothetical protein EOL70_03870 [Leucothrix sargassi]